MNIWNKKLIFGLALFALQGCSTTEEDKYQDRSVESLYNDAMDALQEGSHQEAAKTFEEVDRQHPYSPWATKAQIMAAFANYRAQKYERALAGLEAFLQLHPANPDVPYALYLQGQCYYEQLSPTSRDQKDTLTALQVFKELTTRFPRTDYARDARLKINLLEDALAGKEMDVARFYLNRKSYAAAINRFKAVITHYETTKYIEEALYRLVECYLALGLQESAMQVASVLGHNYPNSAWYTEAYKLLGDKPLPANVKRFKNEASWLDKVKFWKSDSNTTIQSSD